MWIEPEDLSLTSPPTPRVRFDARVTHSSHVALDIEVVRGSRGQAHPGSLQAGADRLRRLHWELALEPGVDPRPLDLAATGFPEHGRIALGYLLHMWLGLADDRVNDHAACYRGRRVLDGEPVETVEVPALESGRQAILWIDARTRLVRVIREHLEEGATCAVLQIEHR